MRADRRITRRELLKAGGGLVVAFSLRGRASAAAPSSSALPSRSAIDAWLAVGADGRVIVRSGKVELGTGVQTALAQIVAEELDVGVERVTIVQGDTARTPDQGVTSGSKTIQRGGPELRKAAAEARQALLELAAARLAAGVDALVVSDGVVSVARERARHVTYAELLGGRSFARTITGAAPLKRPDRYHVVGMAVPRVDIPSKVDGTFVYMQDVGLPGMLHGRVVRPPAPGARLVGVDESSVRDVPGLVRVVRKGDFVGVVAEREPQAIRAAEALRVRWSEPARGGDTGDVHEAMRAAKTSDRVLASAGDPAAALRGAARTVHATYRWPFQMHAAIGPSCAVAEVRGDRVTVWSGTQDVWGLRGALAEVLRLDPERVRVVYVEASGCYGHDGADDVSADAALLSQAVGRPVRVQWMRQDEHGWEPKGSAMLMDVRGGLGGGGDVVAWDYAVWTATDTARPHGHGGNVIAGQLTGLSPGAPFGGGDRNAEPPYAFPSARVVVRWVGHVPLRTSALRGLGAPGNTFANESFVDELAAAAGADPVEFRLRHLRDARGRAVLERAATLARWQRRASPATGAHGGGPAVGRGVAYLHYENANAYVATVAEVEVDRATGRVGVRRVCVAHDCGLIVNPDGLRNQIEGAVLQGISRTLLEAVAFDGSRVTSLDWSSYPILRFPDVPDAVEIALIDRPSEPALGAGEPATCPMPAAIANAVFDATGTRLRTVPFTRDRVKEALAKA